MTDPEISQKPKPTFIVLRVTAEQKRLWNTIAADGQKTLSRWLRGLAEKAARKESKRRGW